MNPGTTIFGSVKTLKLSNSTKPGSLLPWNSIVKSEKTSSMPGEPGSENPLDVQEGGDHYKNYKIQPVEFAMVNGLDLCQANVVKYVVRFRDKNGIEDLKKARHYIDLLIQFEYSRGQDS
jgi:hypothetical protein